VRMLHLKLRAQITPTHRPTPCSPPP
jgi:hypothetical protein